MANPKWSFNSNLDLFECTGDGRVLPTYCVVGYPSAISLPPSDLELDTIYAWANLGNSPTATNKCLNSIFKSLYGDSTYNDYLRQDGALEFQQIYPRKDTHSCADNMLNYVGLTDTFRYCGVCDKKERE